MRSRMALVGAALVASIAVLSSAAPAFGALEGEFAKFAQCPVKVTGVETCLYAVASSGEFTVGSRNVPITNPVILQGGLIEIPETGTFKMAEAVNKETLSNSPQKVPGGLIGIEGLGEVTATTQLAGSASGITLAPGNLLAEEGTALALPVKLKLVGSPGWILGNNCYGGSNSHPIVLNLTTGTTSPPKWVKPIKGKKGTLTFIEGGEILNIAENSLVNNTFAAPGVEGCGLIPFLTDPLVDLAMGVPAGEGHNTAILDGTIKLTGAEGIAERE